MTSRLVSKWVMVVSLASAFAAASACEGDPEKRVAYGDGGEGGGTGVGEGGSNMPVNNGGKAGMPGIVGDAGAAGAPIAGAGGAPIDMPGQGGMPAMAGVPNEPAAGAPSVLPQCEGELVFPDSYVDQLVHTAVDTSGPITQADVVNLTELAIPFNDDDVDLTGIECLSGLDTVDLDRGGQTGIELLAELPNLRSVVFSDPYSVDLDALSALTQLTSLDLHGLAEADFSALASLTNLEDLDLSGVGPFGQVPVDIAVVSSLTKLKTLNLGNVTIKDITPIAGLTKLEVLNLASTQLSSLTSIAPLTALTTLNVSNNALSNVTTLGALPLLSTLNVSYNVGVTSLHPLAVSTYIGSGDNVDVTGSGDCGTSYKTDIQAMLDKGVTVANACGL